jgi:hypothetical protein
LLEQLNGAGRFSLDFAGLRGSAKDSLEHGAAAWRLLKGAIKGKITACGYFSGAVLLIKSKKSAKGREKRAKSF